MSTRFYTKKQLTIINGVLCGPDHEVVQPDQEIIRQANALETLKQKVEYLAKQPEATPMPSLDGFERKSEMDSVVPEFEVSTPIMDFKAHESMLLMNELDEQRTAVEANAMLACFAKLLEFVKSEYVLDLGYPCPRIDTPTLGSILELTDHDVVNVVAEANGLVSDDDDDDYDVLEDILDSIDKAIKSDED